jgi:hypothetical protein
MKMPLPGSLALVTGATPSTGRVVARAEREHG